MLTAEQIRKLIVVRLYVLDGCADRNYLYQHVGIIRGLMWALNNKDPGDILKQHKILDAIQVPYTRDDDGQVWIDEVWLKEHKIDPHRW